MTLTLSLQDFESLDHDDFDWLNAYSISVLSDGTSSREDEGGAFLHEGDFESFFEASKSSLLPSFTVRAEESAKEEVDDEMQNTIEWMNNCSHFSFRGRCRASSNPITTVSCSNVH